jgi:mannosyl-oligosaccharide alpha-1,2-mannosidase
MLTGIGPESFAWSTNGMNGVPSSQIAFYEKAGFYPTNSNYYLRPEVIESFYYAYRATKNPMFQEWAWNAYVAINSTCRVGSGYAELQDVNAANGGGFMDEQDSFFLAEVLKYAYLIHAPVSGCTFNW